MDSGQWTRLKLFRRIIDVIEIDCLFVLLACFDWKPNQSPKKVSTRLVSSLGARRTFRRGPLPVSAWVLTAFWLINITFRFGFPFPSPHKHINTVSCACVPPFGRGGFFWIFSLLLFFFLRFGGFESNLCVFSVNSCCCYCCCVESPLCVELQY